MENNIEKENKKRIKIRDAKTEVDYLKQFKTKQDFLEIEPGQPSFEDSYNKLMNLIKDDQFSLQEIGITEKDLEGFKSILQ